MGNENTHGPYRTVYAFDSLHRLSQQSSWLLRMHVYLHKETRGNLSVSPVASLDSPEDTSSDLIKDVVPRCLLAECKQHCNAVRRWSRLRSRRDSAKDGGNDFCNCAFLRCFAGQLMLP